MAINRILGSSHGGIHQVWIDRVENVIFLDDMPVTAIQLPTRQGSTSWSQEADRSAAGISYKMQITGFCPGINADNLAGFNELAGTKLIAWVRDYHGERLVVGTLTEPLRITIKTTIPADHKNAQGFTFELTGQQLTGAQVLFGSF